VRDELRGRRVRVVLLAAHLDHPAARLGLHPIVTSQ
jgi:hypothetical protein